MNWWIVKQLRAMILADLRDFIPQGYFESAAEKFKLDDGIANGDHFSHELSWGALAGDLGRRLFFDSALIMSPRQVSASEVLMHLGILASAEAAEGVTTQLSKQAEAMGISDGDAGAVAMQLRDQQIPTLSNNVMGGLEQYLCYLTPLEAEPFFPLLITVPEPYRAHIHLFISSVSAEFGSYRAPLRDDLSRPNVTVKVQEDFIATGTETLDKLDEYIRHCDAVIHLVGDMTGALAQAPSVVAIRSRYPDLVSRLPELSVFLETNGPALPYTQWEAWLALYHGRVLIIATPEDSAFRDVHYQLVEEQRDAQRAHLRRLATVERYPEIRFANADRLAVELLRSKLHDILARSQAPAIAD